MRLRPTAHMSEDQGTNEEATVDTTEEQRNANPMTGCVLFIILFSVFAFVFAWFGYKYYDLKKTTWAISEETPKEFPVVEAKDAELNSIENKLEEFSDKVKAKKEKVSVSFTAEEINLAIQNFKRLESLKGQLYVTAIKDDGLHCEMALSVKKGITGGNRYVNGTLIIRPQIEQGSIFPYITSLESNVGKEHTKEEAYQNHISAEIGNDFREDEEIKDVFHFLTEVSTKNGVLTVTSDPNVAATPASKEVVQEGLNKGLMIVFLLCFMFGTTIMFFLWWKKDKITGTKEEA